MCCRFVAAALAAVVVVQLCSAGEIETLAADNVGEDLGVKVKAGGFFSALQTSGSFTMMQAGGFEEEEASASTQLGEALGSCADDSTRRRSGKTCAYYKSYMDYCGKAKRETSRRRAWVAEAKDTCKKTCGLCIDPWPESKFNAYFPFTCKRARNYWSRRRTYMHTCLIAMSTATTAVPNEKTPHAVYNFMKNWRRRRLGKIGTSDSAWETCDDRCTSCTGAIDGDILKDSTKGWMFGSCKTVHMYWWNGDKQLAIPKSESNMATYSKFHKDFKTSYNIKYMRLVMKKQQVCFPGKSGHGNDCRVRKSCNCAYSLSSSYTSRGTSSQDSASCKNAYKATDGSGKAFLDGTQRECGIL